MKFQEVLSRVEAVNRAIETEHPELREIVRGARASARRISERYKVDGDSRRADREIALLLLDLAEATERQVGVERDFPHEEDGGPPSRQTLERVRAQNRATYGIADGGGPRGFVAEKLGQIKSTVSSGAKVQFETSFPPVTATWAPGATAPETEQGPSWGRWVLDHLVRPIASVAGIRYALFDETAADYSGFANVATVLGTIGLVLGGVFVGARALRAT